MGRCVRRTANPSPSCRECSRRPTSQPSSRASGRAVAGVPAAFCEALAGGRCGRTGALPDQRPDRDVGRPSERLGPCRRGRGRHPRSPVQPQRGQAGGHRMGQRRQGPGAANGASSAGHAREAFPSRHRRRPGACALPSGQRAAHARCCCRRGQCAADAPTSYDQCAAHAPAADRGAASPTAQRAGAAHKPVPRLEQAGPGEVPAAAGARR